MSKNKELFINVTPGEVNIALTEDRELVEFSKEKCQSGFAVGDIYLGKVRKLMPGLNAAFVNIGHEKDAFIHYLDLGLQFDALHRLVGGLTAKKNVPKFENLKLAPPLEKVGKLGDHINTGDVIMVQIAKEAISTKGPRLTSEISLAGRHVVLIPFSNKINISQKIKQNSEKKRLKKIVDKVLPKNYGVIIRTAAVGIDDADIEQDILALVAKWEAALAKLKSAAAPVLLSEEMSRANSMLRDRLSGEFKAIYVDDKATYDDTREYIETIAPERSKIVKLFKEGKVPMFDNFDITRQIKSLFTKYVSLKRGAYLIIEHTEALHVVDVNSGNRTKKENDQENTAMDVNLAAAEEIARQLRLRDMGGIIVVDFIDLHKNENRQQLFDKMTELMAADRAKHTILPLSKFGLMQITRQRVRPEAIAEATEVCPYCNGTGTVSPTLSMDKQIEDKIAYYSLKKGIHNLTIEASPYVAAFLTKGFPSLRMRWTMRYGCRISVRADQSTGMIETKILDKKGRILH